MNRTSNYNFTLGVVAGTVIGAGLMMWLAPRAADEARRTVGDSAKALRNRTTEQFGQAGRRVAAAVDELAAKSYGIRDNVADAVADGAHEVARVAVAVKAVPPARQL